MCALVYSRGQSLHSVSKGLTEFVAGIDHVELRFLQQLVK